MELYINGIGLCGDENDEIKSYLRYQQLNIKQTVDVVSLIRSSICDLRLVDSSRKYENWCTKYQYKFCELAKEHVYEVNDHLELSLCKLSDKFESCTDEMVQAYINLRKLNFKLNKISIIKQLYMPRCYSRTLELDIVLADHEAFTKQKDSGELVEILIKKLKSNEYLMYGGSENDELQKIYNLIRFRHYKQVLEGIEELIILIHECVTIMEWRGIANDWRLIFRISESSK